MLAKREGKSLDLAFDREDLGVIVRNAEGLDALINEYLEMGRIEGGKFDLIRQPADFNEILTTARQSMDHLSTQRGTIVTIEGGPSPELDLDRRRMEQVLVNLLSKAIKNSQEHSHIIVRTSQIESKGRSIFRLQEIDEGYGFTPEELAETTTPFGNVYTRQQQKRAVPGTSLELFISRRIIEQHGGTLTIRSAGANKGTEVEILLPFNKCTWKEESTMVQSSQLGFISTIGGVTSPGTHTPTSRPARCIAGSLSYILEGHQGIAGNPRDRVCTRPRKPHQSAREKGSRQGAERGSGFRIFNAIYSNFFAEFLVATQN